MCSMICVRHAMRHVQGQRWQYQQPFQQHVDHIPSSTTRLTHLNFQQELLRDASPLLVQVIALYPASASASRSCLCLLGHVASRVSCTT